MSPAEDTAAIRRRAPIRAADGAILEPEAWEIFDKVAGSVYASLPTLEAATALLARRRRNGPFFPAYIDVDAHGMPDQRNAQRRVAVTVRR